MIEDLEKGFHVTLPTVTFNDRMTLDLGDVTLRLVYFGEGRHMGDDILIHCPEEKLLFTGDLFYEGSMWISGDPEFDAERWVEAMDYVLQDPSQVELIFDTHNGRMKGDFIALWRDYLVDIWKGTNEAKVKGLDLAGVEKQLAFEPHFTYLETSGVGREQLRREHRSNLRYMWYHVNGTQSATIVLEKTLTESGVGAFNNKYQDMRDAGGTEYYFDEAELNRLGYRFISQNELDHAILVFQTNVELYPESSNVYDSLGEAYMIKGETDQAVENYQKSLDLDPGNTNAVEQLKKLQRK
jgi:tetratricopeptide (TPR) repeat protein